MTDEDRRPPLGNEGLQGVWFLAIEDGLVPQEAVRGGTAVPRARSTHVERALRARFRLWIENGDAAESH
jgi:hypothetical protein